MIYNTENINQTKRVVILVLSVIFYISENKPYYVYPTGGWTYYYLPPAGREIIKRVRVFVCY